MKRFTTCFAWLFLLLIAVVAFCGASPAMAAPRSLSGVETPLLLFGFVNMRNLFTRDAIIRYLQQLGPLMPTVVMDTIFVDRPQQPGPLIGSDIFRQTVRAMPLGRRGGRSITIAGGAGQTDFYEPFPIHPDISITGAELNNLRQYLGNQVNLDVWAQSKTDILRRTVRSTAEAMCATALTGTLNWPVQVEGGNFEDYVIDFGNILSVTPDVLLDNSNCKIADVFQLLSSMQLAMQMKGVGGAVRYWASTDAYLALFKLAEKLLSSSKIVVEISDKGIAIGGFLVERRPELYWNPKTNAYVPVVPAKTIKAIAMDAGHMMPYAAIDDLDGGLQPMPFFIKPDKTTNPSGYSLIAESKPLPVVNVDGICDAVVIS